VRENNVPEIIQFGVTILQSCLISTSV